MAKPARIVAFIPLRGGSASIPRKNIRPLAGRPLCDWAIRSALASEVFEEVWVSTDDDAIAAVAQRAGAYVHRRAPETATAQASSESAMLDFARAHPDFDVLALIQATSPLTRPEHFREALAQFQNDKADSLVTATRQHRFRWSAQGEAQNYAPAARPRRQDWPGELYENGAFYLTRKSLLDSAQCRLGGAISVYVMPGCTAFEIDEPEDWTVLEALARRHGYAPPGPAIRLFAMDVDGVLTDGRVHYTEQGEVAKTFSMRDGHGLAMLRERGVVLGIITREATGFARARAAKLGIERVALGVLDKLATLDAWRCELNLEWSAVAYFGDDLPDLPCIEMAGVGACPADAEPEILAAADFVAGARGGRGAVREFVRHLIATQRA